MNSWCIFGIWMSVFLIIEFVVIASNIDVTDESCCWKTSGSCRTFCEQVSLVAIGSNSTLREESLFTLQNFCSPQLVEFWLCINQTFSVIRRGENWSGRQCCHLPQLGKCQKACVFAAAKKDLVQTCRESDELMFYSCLSRQEFGDNCCGNARSADCLKACKMIFKNNRTPSREVRKSLEDSCGDSSPKVFRCIKNYIKLTPATNTHKYFHCCDKSDESNCTESCKKILRTKTTVQEIVESLQEEGCGPPLPHNKFWQCFLRPGTPSENLGVHSEVSRIDRMGIDSAKLHCCNKANSNTCRRLCIKTFSDEWTTSWKDFDRECLSQLSEENLFHCIDEVEEPCELGCDGLSYCTNYNNRPTELFRSCNSQADEAARYDVALWQQQGFFLLPGGIKILVKNISSCSPNTWKAVACALQVKPCHRQNHINRICRDDCFEVLSQCMDWSRMPMGQTAASLCSKLSVEKSSCVSLKPFLEPSDNPYVEPALDVTAPCKGNPCGPKELCLVNRNCFKGKRCKPYTCVPGCKMGEISHFMVPYGTYVRIPVPSENKGCQKICRCSKEGVIENCQPMPCVPFDDCWLGSKRIEHGSWFFLDCNVCSCLSGEITCSKRQCEIATTTLQSKSFTSLPCGCPLHHVPVCGRNGNTYPSSCLAKCAGLKDSDFEFGPCSAKDPCETNPCGEGYKCIPARKVCLSLLEKPCRQYKCVDMKVICSEVTHDPVCDTEQVEHYNLCYLLKSAKTLAYRGSCLLDCRNEGPVCGIDGETYSSQCSALANYVLVDYRGPCIAVGLISKEAKPQCGPAVACSPLPVAGCFAVTPPGACCPICAVALRFLYSRKQVDRALYALRGTPTNALTVAAILNSLERQIQIAECALKGFLTVELDIFVAIVSRNQNQETSEHQREVCMREGEKLATLVRQSSPRLLSELGLSSLTAATVVHVLASSGFRKALSKSMTFFSLVVLLVKKFYTVCV